MVILELIHHLWILEYGSDAAVCCSRQSQETWSKKIADGGDKVRLKRSFGLFSQWSETR